MELNQPLSFIKNLKQLSGFAPKTWLSVGQGYSREDLKAILFRDKISFIAQAVTNAEEIALRIIAAHDSSFAGTTSLSSLARQEILRVLLAETRINSRMPELKRLRRQGNFYRRLDFAMQAGRMAFLHAEEESVYCDRLEKRFGDNPLRNEIRALSLAYEAFLGNEKLLDAPAAFKRALEILEEQWPQRLNQPEEIYVFSVSQPESLEKAFWETLTRYSRVERVQEVPGNCEQIKNILHEKWHTLDDGAEALAEDLVRLKPAQWSKVAILISDSSSARASLSSALGRRGVKLADPRDPTRLKWDEKIKWASLPLDLVARNFERAKVISFLKYMNSRDHLNHLLVREINQRGTKQGIKSYAGGKLAPLFQRLEQLAESFGPRQTCAELGRAHLKFLKQNTAANSELSWLVGFFEKFWAEFVEDITRVGLDNRSAPLLFWLERYNARLGETPSPLERIRPEFGVLSYRAHQAPTELNFDTIYIFGLGSDFFSSKGVGDYWFSDRERETLSSEFAVRSSIQVGEERKAVLKKWLTLANKITVIDAHYSADGRERETIAPVLASVIEGDLPSVRERGSYQKFIKSFGAVRPLPSLQFQLPPIPVPASGKLEIRASILDRYSRCSFQALAYHRWRLEDFQEPDTEIWPSEKGNLLHQAVKILVASRDGEGNFKISPMIALNQAWSEQPPRGLFKNDRVIRYVKYRITKVLEAFCEKEREYVQRSQSTPILLDEGVVKLDLGDFAVVGQPDRVDENDAGLFVIDYKTSSASPHGSDMFEKGYRLQLPAYALALSAQFEKPIVGVQFVELTRKAGRSSGIFFNEFNGKELGKFTNARANSKSLLSDDPLAVWSQLADHVKSDGKSWIEGKFHAQPKHEKECVSCQIAELCGLKRVESGGGATEGEGE